MCLWTMKTGNVTMDDVYVGMNNLNFLWTLYCAICDCDGLCDCVNELYVIVNGLYDFIYRN
jgi:hypothetical protein